MNIHSIFGCHLLTLTPLPSAIIKMAKKTILLTYLQFIYTLSFQNQNLAHFGTDFYYFVV